VPKVKTRPSKADMLYVSIPRYALHDTDVLGS